MLKRLQYVAELMLKDYELKRVKQTASDLREVLIKKGVDEIEAHRYIGKDINSSYLKVCHELISEYVGIPKDAVRETVYEDLGLKTLGSFTKTRRKVSINNRATLMNAIMGKDYRFFERTVETLLHEYRHAWQYINNPEILDNYISPENDQYAYYNHPCEIDARSYAKENTGPFINIMEEYIGYFLLEIHSSLDNWLECELFSLEQ